MKYFLVTALLLFCGFGCNSVVSRFKPPVSSDKPTVSTNTVEPESSANITVSSPIADATVTNPIHVTGQARVFENVVSWRLLSTDGSELVKGTDYAEAPDMGQFGSFDFWVVVPEVQNKNITLEVYQASAKDGSAIDVVSIPLVLDRINTTDLKLYFHNNVMDPEITCTTVFSVTRKITATILPARAVMIMLLQGPTDLEIANHYSTAIPFRSELNDISISGEGLTTVDLGGAVAEPLGGSCLVAGISAEIENTLKQFDAVKEIKILLNGQEDSLQP